MKKYIAIVILTLVFFGWTFREKAGTHIETINQWQIELGTPKDKAKNITGKVINTSQHPVTSSSANTDSKTTNTYDGWDPRLSQESKNWYRSRGYFSDVDLQEYKGFKFEKLEKLADAGDLKAIEVLSQLERASGNWSRYKQLLEMGAIYGSLKALNRLSIEKRGDYVTSKKVEDALEFFAYMHLEAKRGDLYIKDKIPLNSEIYNFYPDEQQQNYINRRSDELMADLENQRKLLGLPPFDNTPLETFREIYETADTSSEL